MDPANKKASTEALLARAAREQRFQQVLEDEARALTKIGNDFQIRHFEKGKVTLTEDPQVDYLFHRLFALIWLLLASIRADTPESAT